MLKPAKKPGLSPLEKKIPVNAKYSHIPAVIDSGITIFKLKEILASEIKGKDDEIFKRIKASTLASLIASERDEESVYALGNGTETVKVVVDASQSDVRYNLHYLLLDVRNVEEYDKYHITSAFNHPSQKLFHVNCFTADIIRYKNHAERIIIVCDDDEKVSGPAARTIAEKGVDNVYLLSGGITKFLEKFPDLVQGDVPKPPPSTAKTAKSASSSRISTTTSIPRAPSVTSMASSKAGFGSAASRF
mmetsp:Transcript_6768/g.10557  ORF Transcript_6768/g.10557 Transcript_6768/m.10557 type:complete len:247 (+) Transcript_6768:30-770(+)|eukprot:CAMPEP_0184335162 /NCGR_PEP_ID=MMETSP1089-20130417/3780_1 /TAXON_ID=38269 ORGANISM="Gloeochaete wittrockiana, Strain SAG46.84" /NCGR_SAMPLE_ID=MMETSP1089 /ASSEMBLY_ACC=CAM_ASM_000445 /LENGTH=246 /DNA_ID=CAMNT_0026659699 /DNA_START=28 /DNA_END=768 /DNA_ORIENTATION=+